MKTLAIILHYPDSVGAAEIKDYAKTALERWGGQLFPGDQNNAADHLFNSTRAFKKDMRVVVKEPSYAGK